jgi:hypothetical protein
MQGRAAARRAVRDLAAGPGTGAVADAGTGLRGRVHARTAGPLRVAVTGADGSREVPVVAGRWRIEGLRAGTYRVELVGARVVISRRVEVAVGERAIVDFVVW